MTNQPAREEPVIGLGGLTVHGMVLAQLLGEIEAADTDYATRYGLVWRAVGHAAKAGLQVGVAIDAAEPDWPVVYIELPDGQVSWHMPKHECEWDGHSTEEKYRRCRAFAARYDVMPPGTEPR